MTVESDTSIAPASTSTEATTPAPVADDQKPGAAPASGADVQNTETAADTPEQIAAKAESRRARSNARKAQVLAEARAEAKILREEVDRLRTQGQPAPASDEPKRSGINPKTGAEYTYEEYVEARAEWRADQRVTERFSKAEKAQQGKEGQQRTVERNAELAKQWTQREKEFSKTVKDYDAVVNEFADGDMQDLHQAARAAIVESELGPALLFHLATDTTGIVDRLAGLSPARQIAELGKIEATGLTKTAKPSNAPDPIKPLGQGRAGPSDPNKMTDAEYKAFRKSQGARWAQ